MCDAMLAALCVGAGDEAMQGACMLTDVRFLQPLVLNKDVLTKNKGDDQGGLLRPSCMDVEVDWTTGAIQLRYRAAHIATARARQTHVADDLHTQPATRQQRVLLGCGTPPSVLSSVAHIAAAHRDGFAPREGFVLMPDCADAVLQLGVVPVGSPVKIPVAVDAVYVRQPQHHVLGSSMTAYGYHNQQQHYMMAACCTMPGVDVHTHMGCFTTDHGVGIHGLHTSTMLPRGVLAAHDVASSHALQVDPRHCVYATHTPVAAVVASENTHTAQPAPTMLTMHVDVPDSMLTQGMLTEGMLTKRGLTEGVLTLDMLTNVNKWQYTPVHAALTMLAAVQQGGVVNIDHGGLAGAAAGGILRVACSEQQQYEGIDDAGFVNSVGGVQRVKVLRAWQGIGEEAGMHQHVRLQGMGSFDALTQVPVDRSHVGAEELVIRVEVCCCCWLMLRMVFVLGLCCQVIPFHPSHNKSLTHTYHTPHAHKPMNTVVSVPCDPWPI